MSSFFFDSGTQTLKGYPMFPQNGSSSEKEMVDDVPERKRDLRDRIPLKSRENHQPKGTPRHIRAEHDRPIRELRERPDRDHGADRDHDLKTRADRDHEMKTRSDREKNNLRDVKERNEREIKVKSETHDKDTRTTNEEKDTR